ncbi:MAG: protein O-mannosyl-transferase family [Paludibacteraceae bacterium]
MKKFNLWNALCGWVVFAIAAATYLLTIEPTASFWDCGEFISSAHKLDVGHPPGAPFFMLMGHFASLFASDASHVAMCVNALSALASAFTILFLFWTITALARKLVAPDTIAKGIGILAAGAVGALAYTFSDTFWFSAVEGEVYASSSLFTAIVFWLILKWDEHADEEGSDKWLILIAYLMGLSIGIHLLNLLTIPAIVLVYYFRRYTFSWKGVVLAFAASVAILAVILYGIIPGFPTVAGWFELLFVNGLGCPFNTGLAVYIVLTILMLGWAIYESMTERNKVRQIVSFVLAFVCSGAAFLFESWWIGLIVGLALLGVLLWKKDMVPSRLLNTASLMIAVILIGYSSYAALVIRSAAQTPMDQNSPDNVFSLKYYLNREQYGDRPLFYGQVYNAPVELEIKGNMCIPVEKQGHAQYAPAPKEEGKKDRYVITGYKTNYVFMKEFCMLFPRMYSSQGSHVQAYKEWADVKGKRVRYDYCGQQKTEYCPTFAENLRFFFRYQVNFMYWRYFMWNFAGRQNDLQSYGDITKGNWISGIPFIDNAMLGDQSKLPTELRENKGHNVYYMLPLLLGLIGIIWQCGKRTKEGEATGWKSFTLTFLLFFLTGLAIVVYLNQTPYQPRERDYAYAGSFYAFCIWIGLGVLALVDWANSLMKNEKMRAAVAVVIGLVCLLVPAQMASQNWDDHDRSHRYACRDFGANYLKSCEKEAVIFCNGDNDTFPLWYNQEVEEVGTDARACNLSYLQTDWYIDAMRRPYYDSPGLPISWEYKDYMPGKNEVVWVDNKLGPISVDKAFTFLRSDDPRTKNREGENYLPSNQLYVLSPDGEQIMFKSARRYTRSEMMIMEMLSQNNWQRPIYFAATVGDDYYLGLQPYFELTGMAYQVTPVRSADGQPRVNTGKMYDNMMHKFAYGNMNYPGIYIDENTMRMCRTHRMMFARLAEALIREGQRDKALEVLDYSEEMLPGYNISYDYTSASMASMYLLLGQPDKANAILENVAMNCVEYLEWGTSLGKKSRLGAQGTLEQQAAIFGYVLQTWERYGQNEMFEQYYPLYVQYAGR